MQSHLFITPIHVQCYQSPLLFQLSHIGYPYHATGPLQIQFLSGATRHIISQYSETENFLLHPMYPCQCFNDVLEDREVSIMWVKNVPDSVSLNHIIPLVPKRGKIIAHLKPVQVICVHTLIHSKLKRNSYRWCISFKASCSPSFI